MPHTEAEAIVLATLKGAGPLSISQLTERAALTEKTVRVAAMALHDSGLVEINKRRNPQTWELSQTGRRLADTARGRALMDVPRRRRRRS